MKILEPGRPGDLVMIVETAWAELQRLQREEPANDELCHGVAVAATEALCMWLGLIDIPDDGKGQAQPPGGATA